MDFALILDIFEAAALLVICFLKLINRKESQPVDEARNKETEDLLNERLEKAWNDGIANILGYDMTKAKGASRYDE